MGARNNSVKERIYIALVNGYPSPIRIFILFSMNAKNFFVSPTKLIVYVLGDIRFERCVR